MQAHILNRSVMRPLLALVAIAVLGACAAPTEPPAHPVNLPDAFVETSPPGGEAPAPDWWRGFDSAELVALVDRALADNPDLIIATERVRQAEAQAQISGASLFPALGFGTSVFQREARGSADASAGSNISVNAALSASYELDVWGQNASSARSAEFALRATRYERETVRMTLVGGVGSAYFQLLSLRGRLAIARENLSIADRVFKVVNVRQRNGAASQLDLARQQSVLLGQQAAILPLELQERQLLYALAVLVDQAPQRFTVRGASVLQLRVPEVAPGLPASLLVRRPDLASAEARLAAANASLSAARAALLPTITLTASTGAASSALSGLVNAPALALAVGASLLQPIFDAGRLRAQVTLAQSHQQELVLGYRKAIQAALVDVESALAARSRLGEQELLLTESLAHATRGLRLSEIRLREGADDLIVVLDAQRTLFQAQDQLAQVRQSRLQATLDLFKALGGGWKQL